MHGAVMFVNLKKAMCGQAACSGRQHRLPAAAGEEHGDRQGTSSGSLHGTIPTGEGEAKRPARVAEAGPAARACVVMVLIGTALRARALIAMALSARALNATVLSATALSATALNAMALDAMALSATALIATSTGVSKRLRVFKARRPVAAHPPSAPHRLPAQCLQRAAAPGMLLHPFPPSWEVGGCGDRGHATSSHQLCGDEPSSYYTASPGLRADDCSNYNLLQSIFHTAFSGLEVVQGFFFSPHLAAMEIAGSGARGPQLPRLTAKSHLIKRCGDWMCRSTSLFFFFPLKNCHFSCSKQTRCIVPATRLPPTTRQNPACKIPAACMLPAPSRHRRASRLTGKGGFSPGREEKTGVEIGLRAWQRRGGQMWSGDGADCSCFTSSLFPFHFISPWMPARGGG